MCLLFTKASEWLCFEKYFSRPPVFFCFFFHCQSNDWHDAYKNSDPKSDRTLSSGTHTDIIARMYPFANNDIGADVFFHFSGTISSTGLNWTKSCHGQFLGKAEMTSLVAIIHFSTRHK